MQTHQRQFIEFALKYQALRFGEFKLKSGRLSPYFFNMGVFQDGLALAELGKYYAATLQQTNLKYDMLFGPAYKGIPLVCTTAITLANQYQQNIPYCFNRKEAKDHGEGGNIIGAPLKGKVLIIDDVITAGTAIRDSMLLIQQANAQLAAVIIALDRQERGQQQLSAIAEVEKTYHAKVISIITLADILEYLDENDTAAANAIRSYQQQYGVHA